MKGFQPTSYFSQRPLSKISTSLGSNCSQPSTSLLSKRNFETLQSTFDKGLEKKVKILRETSPQTDTVSQNSEKTGDSPVCSLESSCGEKGLQEIISKPLLSQYATQKFQLLQVDHYLKALSDLKNLFDLTFKFDQNPNLDDKKDTADKIKTIEIKNQMLSLDQKISTEKPINIEQKLKNQSLEVPIQQNLKISAAKEPHKVLRDNIQQVSGQDPALAEFTKKFPEWDLRTIFAFVKNEQQKEPSRINKKVNAVKKSSLKEKKVKDMNKSKNQSKEDLKALVSRFSTSDNLVL